MTTTADDDPRCRAIAPGHLLDPNPIAAFIMNPRLHDLDFALRVFAAVAIDATTVELRAPMYGRRPLVLRSHFAALIPGWLDECGQPALLWQVGVPMLGGLPYPTSEGIAVGESMLMFPSEDSGLKGMMMSVTGTYVPCDELPADTRMMDLPPATDDPVT